MIKSILKENLAAVVELRVSLFEKAGKIKSEDEKLKLSAVNNKYFADNLNPGKMFGYYEELGGAIICIALAVVLEYPPVNNDNLGGQAHIFNVYTEERYRNQGKALQILKLLIEALKNKGIRKISLDANEMSAGLYQKLGFKTNDQYMVLQI